MRRYSTSVCVTRALPFLPGDDSEFICESIPSERTKFIFIASDFSVAPSLCCSSAHETTHAIFRRRGKRHLYTSLRLSEWKWLEPTKCSRFGVPWQLDESKSHTHTHILVEHKTMVSGMVENVAWRQWRHIAQMRNRAHASIVRPWAVWSSWEWIFV